MKRSPRGFDLWAPSWAEPADWLPRAVWRVTVENLFLGELFTGWRQADHPLALAYVRASRSSLQTVEPNNKWFVRAVCLQRKFMTRHMPSDDGEESFLPSQLRILRCWEAQGGKRTKPAITSQWRDVIHQNCHQLVVIKFSLITANYKWGGFCRFEGFVGGHWSEVESVGGHSGILSSRELLIRDADNRFYSITL